MSQRAYKLIEIKTEEEPSFNITWNWEFISHYFEAGDSDIIEITEDNLKQMEIDIKDEEYLKKCDIDKEIAEEIYENIKRDMGDEGYVEYYCY
ncbi:hypothetical protein EOM09_07660 [bacterium]|nr:hypothetical protein [bacterium]